MCIAAPSSSTSYAQTIWADLKTETDPNVLLQNGIGCESGDPVRAKKLYRDAADRGSVEAMVRLGILLFRGCGEAVPRDEKEAVRLFQMAAEKKNADGMAWLGKALFCGLGGLVPNRTQAIDLWKKASDGGSTEAMAYLGCAYYFGVGVDRDTKEAFRLCTKASDRGNANGMYYLGVLKVNGVMEGGGVGPIDGDGATDLWTKSADLGNSKAMRSLAARSWHNPEYAFRLCTRSVELGNVWAMDDLADLFLEGKFGTPNGTVNAVRLYSKAASLGDRVAMYYLATLHIKGEGCQRDEREAKRWQLFVSNPDACRLHNPEMSCLFDYRARG